MPVEVSYHRRVFFNFISNPTVTTEQLETVKKILSEKCDGAVCPMCSKAGTFVVLPEFTFFSIKAPTLPGPFKVIPCAVTVCQNCGFMSSHAAGMLGIDPKLLADPKTDAALGAPGADADVKKI
ncbi:hypothetical protein [Prosthecobacter vanneervenii]|uniref:Uncharacterized protein n=1 Tax=Prosthecobacter vanneervenii TaxID=48466 RepID=A0A7W7Y764_9BACT|nr:hypothetical protein [Prosthecobacter vanneervenii]MBB5030862.1 hypothetical protein [Prosthecobacter vanneervenii]